MNEKQTNKEVLWGRTYRETPVHAKVNRNEDEVDSKNVNLASPSSDTSVASAHYLGVEERVEGMNFEPCATLIGALVAPVHEQIHVEVDDL